MDIELLTERYAAQIAGALSCWDRVLVFGTLPKICYAGGITSYLFERKIRIVDYPKIAEPFRDQLRENAERLAAAASIQDWSCQPWNPARRISRGVTGRPQL